MTRDEHRALELGRCADCGYRGFVLGPRGGAAQNIECGSLTCRARFNVVQNPLGQGLVFAERIPKERNGGARWQGTHS